MLVLLAATARAKVVATHLLLDVYWSWLALVALTGCRCCCHSRGLQLVYIDFRSLLTSLLYCLRIALLNGYIGLVQYCQDVAVNLFEHLRE